MQQSTEFNLFTIQRIILMNSKKRKTSDLERILFYLREKMNLKRSYIFVTLLNLSIYYTEEVIQKQHI